MKVSRIGEFGLIEVIRKSVSAQKTPPELLIGIGDDAAAWQTGNRVELATTDTMVEGVHFNLPGISWTELGWKSLAINISDIAAMGGQPQYALVSLCLRQDCRVEAIKQFYKGMLGLAQKYDVAVVGGNISASPVYVITITVTGVTTVTKKLLTRSSAAAGDKVAVTGYLGSSAAGLNMLTQSLIFNKQTSVYLRKSHLMPEPRVYEGRLLAANGIRTAIDISDGLISDLTQICKASDKGATIFVDKLPVHPLVKKAFKDEARDMALTGGEDYELLFTGEEKIIRKIAAATGVPVTIIGEITGEHPGRVNVSTSDGKNIDYSNKGWEHFVSR